MIAAHLHPPCGRRYSDSTKQRRINLLVIINFTHFKDTKGAPNLGYIRNVYTVEFISERKLNIGQHFVQLIAQEYGDFLFTDTL